MTQDTRAPPTFNTNSAVTVSELACTLNLEDWDTFLEDYVDNDLLCMAFFNLKNHFVLSCTRHLSDRACNVLCFNAIKYDLCIYKIMFDQFHNMSDQIV